MRKMLLVAAMAAITLTQACTLVGNTTELGIVAKDMGMKNITTGDGEFEDYTAVDYNAGMEIGIAVGIPGLFKLMELYPAKSNEALMGDVAGKSKAHGADAMINVTPPQERYLGFPFFIVGVYVDTCDGTGIKLK